MKIQQKLIRGKLLRRYKRFLADVELDESGEEITVHCPDPGSMLTVSRPGRRVLLAQYSDPGRKLPYGLEFIHNGRCWIGVHPRRANAIVAEALAEGRIPELAGYRERRGEAYFDPAPASDVATTGGRTRFDFYLYARATEGPGEDDAGAASRAKGCYLEVKSVTMMRAGDYGFPDSVTLRGQRHLRELMAARRAGYRAVLLFLVQRSDGRRLRMADDIDPEYARLAREAVRAGVEILAYATRIRVNRSGASIRLSDQRIPFAPGLLKVPSRRRPRPPAARAAGPLR